MEAAAGGVAASATGLCPGLGTTTNTDQGSASIPGAPTAKDLEPFGGDRAKAHLIMSSGARSRRTVDRRAGRWHGRTLAQGSPEA